MVIDSSEYDLVVIDAANVIHTEISDDEGNPIKAIFPERLSDAIEYCIECGWAVKAFLKHGTFLWAVSNSDFPNVGDVKILDRLIKSELLELVNQEKEDMHWIDYALRNSGLIITHDRFKLEKEDYPDFDWELIERSTLRDYNFTADGQFIIPSLPIKGEGSRLTMRSMKSRIADLEERVLYLEMLIGNTDSAAPEESASLAGDDMGAVVSEVFDSLLKNGDAVHMTTILHTLASALLGLDLKLATKQGSWPSDWKESLKEMVGVEGKMTKWVHELSPRELEFDGKSQFVNYSYEESVQVN